MTSTTFCAPTSLGSKCSTEQLTLLLLKPQKLLRSYFFLVVERAGDEDLQLPLGQLRLACRLDQDIFSSVVVPDETQTTQATQLSAPRTGTLPPVSALSDSAMVMNAGYRLHNSSASGGLDVPADFYTKYSWAVSSDKDLVHGAMGTNASAGKSVGVFLIQPSHEYLNGGPAHAEIATHQDSKSTCFLFHGAGTHYNYHPPVAPLGWRKLIGPAFVRMDGAADAAQLRRGAVDSATELQRRWPYAWMQHELWAPPEQRGKVLGSLEPTAPLDHGPSIQGGLAILGDPVSDSAKLATPECVQALSVRCKGFDGLSPRKCASNCGKELAKATEQSICTPQTLGAFCSGTLERPLDLQGLGYTFWGNLSAERKGFEIRGVRAGDYSLWVRLPGCLPVQQLLVPKLSVEAGGETQLGQLAVPNKRRGARRVWQIGLADASVAEFRHGRDAMDHVRTATVACHPSFNTAALTSNRCSSQQRQPRPARRAGPALGFPRVRRTTALSEPRADAHRRLLHVLREPQLPRQGEPHPVRAGHGARLHAGRRVGLLRRQRLERRPLPCRPRRIRSDLRQHGLHGSGRRAARRGGAGAERGAE